MTRDNIKTYWFGEGTNVVFSAPEDDVVNYNKYLKAREEGVDDGSILADDPIMHESYLVVTSLIGKAVFGLDQNDIEPIVGQRRELVEFPEELSIDYSEKKVD